MTKKDSSSSGITTKKEGRGMCGLVNQGATCYLNALLQNLFYDVHIRESILSSMTENVLVSAIQGLFARLMLSEATSIKTTDLVTAFGWGRASVFEQHDAQELLTVLLDSLGESCPDIKARLTTILHGSVEEYLECPECQFKRAGVSSFMNISLELPTHDDKMNNHESEVEDLSALLHSHMRTEILDSDNKWECGGCQQKVQAKKYNLYKTLPPSLFIHLKRFRYNLKLRRREKITSAITFPERLDTSMLTGENGKYGPYRLQGILLHTGTASGGHYKSYNRISNQQWLECNDARVREMTEQEIVSMFLSTPTNEVINEIESQQNEHTSSVAVVSKNSPSRRRFVEAKDDLLRQNAYMLLYKLDTSDEDQLELLNDRCLKSIREEVKTAIQAENEQLVESRRLQEMQQKVVVLQIFVCNSPADDDDAACSSSSTSLPQLKTTLTVTISDIFSEILDKVIVQLHQEHQMNLIRDDDIIAPSGTSCRLRMYDAIKGRAGETFGERLQLSLQDLGFKGGGTQTTLLLETRNKEKDPLFVEYDPKDMQVRMLIWSEEVNQALNLSDGVLLNQLIAGDLDRNALMMEDESSDQPLGLALSRAITTLMTAVQVVHVGGREKATVKHLRDAVTDKVMVDVDQTVVIIQTNDRGTYELCGDDDSKGLRTHFGLWPSDLIIVEVIKKDSIQHGDTEAFTEEIPAKEASEKDGTKGDGTGEEIVGAVKPEKKGNESVALQVIKSLRHYIRIQFNDPRISSSTTQPITLSSNDTTALPSDTSLLPSSSSTTTNTIITSTGDLHTYSLRVSSELSLYQLKEEISKTLMDSSLCFHVQGASFKDESKTLIQLGLCNMSILHLVAGKGCQPGEHMLRFECDLSEINEEENKKVTPTLIFLGELPVSEKWTIRQLKEHLLQQWASFESSTGTALLPPPPTSPHNIRIRDGGKSTTTTNAGAGGTGGSLLRDDRVLCRCLLGLADHRRIILQILPVPEIIDKDDWIFSIRIATYTSMEDSKMTHKYATKRIHRMIDLPIARTSTVQQLYQKLLEMFPFFQMTTAMTDPTTISSTAESSNGSSTIHDMDDDPMSSVHSSPFPESQAISVAKGYATGPAMTLKSSLKLTWNLFQQYPTEKLNASILGLRDGTVLVVRGVTDFHQSQMAGITSSSTDHETEVPSSSSSSSSATTTSSSSAMINTTPDKTNKRIPPWKLKGSNKTTAASSSVDDIATDQCVTHPKSPKRTGGIGSTASRKPIEKGIHIAVSRPSAVLKSAQTLDLTISNTMEIMPDPNLDDQNHHSSVVLPPTSPFPGKENYHHLLNGDINDTEGLEETKGIPSSEASKGCIDELGNNLEAAPVRVVRALRENGDIHGKV